MVIRPCPCAVCTEHIYWPQRSCGQGNILTPVCHSVHRGGVLPQCMLGYQPPRIRQTPPDQTPPPLRTRQTPLDQTPPRTRQTPPPQHTVYERPVRILLECILVYYRNPSFPVPCPVQCEHAIRFT